MGHAMQNSFAIIWVAKNKDRSGVSPKRFSKEQAEALAEELNASHSEFQHEVVDTAHQEVGEALIALKERIFGAARTLDYSSFAAVAAVEEEELVEEEPAVH